MIGGRRHPLTGHRAPAYRVVVWLTGCCVVSPRRVRVLCSGACYRCGERGHNARDCRRSRSVPRGRSPDRQRRSASHSRSPRRRRRSPSYSRSRSRSHSSSRSRSHSRGRRKRRRRTSSNASRSRSRSSDRSRSPSPRRARSRSAGSRTRSRSAGRRDERRRTSAGKEQKGEDVREEKEEKRVEDALHRSPARRPVSPSSHSFLSPPRPERPHDEDGSTLAQQAAADKHEGGYGEGASDHSLQPPFTDGNHAPATGRAASPLLEPSSGAVAAP